MCLLLTLPALFGFFVFVVRTQPPSVAVTSAAFGFARPEYFQAFLEVGFRGSFVNSAPRLPMPERPETRCLRMWQDVSRVMAQMSSGETCGCMVL